MKDPTRIPAVLAALQRAWEGQPDLNLASLWGVIENHGIGWGSGDDELVAVLGALSRRHPARVTSPENVLVVADTAHPLRRITVDPVGRRVTVRGADVRPATWNYREIRRLEVGMPAVITDAAGVDHRLGVLSGMTVSDYRPPTGLGGRARTAMGDLVVGARLIDGALVIVSHGVDVFTPGRRDVAHTRHRYDRLLEVEVGAPLRFQPAAGGKPVALAEVELLFPVDQ